MPEVIELKIKNTKNIYQELAKTLENYKDKPQCSVRFIVEGNLQNPLVAIDYPGRKMFKRESKSNREGIAQYANLFDFMVVPYKARKPLGVEDFTFEKFLEDFKNNKSDNEEFWKMLQELYYSNTFYGDPPKLPGIDPRTFLLTLKWIWLEEDLNYKFKWEDTKSKTKYVLAKISKKTGKEQPVSRGAGRAKFFAALVLLKRKDFSYEEVKKIIPLFN